MSDQIADLYASLRLDSVRYRIDLDAAERKLLGFRGSLTDVTNAAAGIFKGIAFAAVVGGTAAAVSGLIRGVSAASDLGESVSKVGVTFGNQSGIITKAADEMAAQFGTVKGTFLDAASGIGLIAQGAGISGKASADLAVELAKLADDASSFYNVSLEEALGKIKSGLVGESEPLRAFGVLLSEGAVQSEALRLGLAKSSKGLDEQAKVLARVSLIRRGLTKAEGDHARTQDSPKNRQREISGRTTNALTSVGEAVTPIWSELLGQVNAAGKGMGDFFQQNRGEIASWASGVAANIREVIAGAKDLYGSFQQFLGSESGTLIREGVGGAFVWLKGTVASVVGGIGDSLETVGFAMRNWDDIAQITVIQINQGLTDIGATFEWLGTAVGAFINWFSDNWTSIFADALSVTVSLFQSFGDILKGEFEQIKGFLSDPLHFKVDLSKFNPVDQFKKVVDDLSKVDLKAPPLVIPGLKLDHTEADRQIAEITDGIGRREAGRPKRKLAGAATDQPGAPAQAGEDETNASDKKKSKGGLVAGQSYDLAQFAKALQAGAFGTNDPALRTAKATEATRDEMRRLAGAIIKQGAGKFGINPAAIAVGPA
jgi:hypothetical protein